MQIFRKYSEEIQFHPTQIAAIAGAVRARGRGCNMLVFGLGNDTPLWTDVNAEGHTLFLEDDAEWLATVSARLPGLQCRKVDYGSTTVASALRDPAAVIRDAKAPAFLLERDWDVILIDGPRGFRSGSPGRALPICWAAQIRRPGADVFVDDAHRELERRYADFLLVPGAGNSVLIPRPGTGAALLWVMGDYLPTAVPRRLAKRKRAQA